MRTNTTVRAVGLLAAVLALPAWASFHFMDVVEVFPGTAASPNAQYVVIQMYSGGQNFVGGHALTVFNATGALVSTFTFSGDVGNGNNQAKILIATSEAQSFFNVTPDLTMSAALLSAGGKVCWAGTIDCVAWGAYSGSATGVGTPYNAASGLKSGKAAKRRLDISGSASVLDAGDDTNNSANDFVEGLPAPRNNFNIDGTIPPATCGNGVIEGLEECDDHDLEDGDGCSSICTITPVLPTLSIADVSVSEGNSGTSVATFTVTLSQPSASDVTYDIGTADNTATAGSDYGASSLSGESIPAGQASKTFTVTINGDTTIEPDETYTVNLSNASGALIADAQAIGKISNDDLPSLLIGDVAIFEGNSSTSGATFTVTLSQPSASAVTFNIATANGTATAGSDYVASNLTNQSIPAGQTSKSFSVAIKGDTTIEPNETFTVNLSNASGATIADAQAVGTIINDDLPSLSIGDASLIEGNSGTKTLIFTVHLSAAAPTGVTYNIATANGTATAGSDYVASSLNNQLIPAGNLSKVFNVTIDGDTTMEPNETFTVNLSNASGAKIADAQAVGTITSDDLPSLSIGDASVTEGNSGQKTLAFTVHLSQAAPFDVIYNIATADGTARHYDDYGEDNQRNLIPAGNLSKPFNVTILGDTTIEPNETFTVTLSNAVNATISDAQAVGTIINDDLPSLSIGDAAITEGNSGTKVLTFTVHLSAAAPTGVTYNIATADGTATAGSDYVANSLNNQLIPAGSLSKPFSVTVDGDATVEPNETFGVNLSTASGATISDFQAIGTITNDDGPTLSIGDVAVAEGNSGVKTLSFTVQLSQAAATDVTYDIATADGTATASNDYVANSLSSQLIPAGNLNKPFTVTIDVDTAVEPNETFTVNLSNASGASILDAQAVGTIINDDGPTLSISDVATTEGNSGTKVLTFTVHLSQAATTGVTYSIATANGTATAGSDYVANSLSSQLIPAGNLSKPFVVTLNGDTTVEPNETFTATISNASGATISDAQAIGTITNDDTVALRVARVATSGLFDDIDDGNRAPLLSTNDYARLLRDTAQKICWRAGTATIVAVDGVENRAVLEDLADATNVTCNSEPHYAAVMGQGDSRGFLIEVPTTPNTRGLQVLSQPETFTDADSTGLSVLAVGQDRLITVLLASAAEGTPQVRRLQAQALEQRVQQRFAQDTYANVIVLGANAVNGLVDLTARAQPRANLHGTALPNDRILVSPGLLRLFSRAHAEFVLLPTTDEPAQYLQLQQ